MARGYHNKIVILNTDQGYFSGFMPVWNAQGIDVESLQEGDKLQITYTENVFAKNGKTYKNFKKVVALPKPITTIKELAESKREQNDEISDDDISRLLNEMD